MFPLSLETKLIAYAVAAAALLAGLAYAIHHFKSEGYAQRVAEDSVAQEQEHERVAKINLRNNELSGALAEHQAAQAIVYQTITRTVDRVVDRPVYRADCLDADGLRLANAALAGTAPDPGIAASAVPAASATSGNDGR